MKMVMTWGWFTSALPTLYPKLLKCEGGKRWKHADHRLKWVLLHFQVATFVDQLLRHGMDVAALVQATGLLNEAEEAIDEEAFQARNLESTQFANGSNGFQWCSCGLTVSNEANPNAIKNYHLEMFFTTHFCFFWRFMALGLASGSSVLKTTRRRQLRGPDA